VAPKDSEAERHTRWIDEVYAALGPHVRGRAAWGCRVSLCATEQPQRQLFARSRRPRPGEPRGDVTPFILTVEGAPHIVFTGAMPGAVYGPMWYRYRVGSE
jgi:hypothetical protein